jgi:phospholipid-binding lipoprotein MlaA
MFEATRCLRRPSLYLTLWVVAMLVGCAGGPQGKTASNPQDPWENFNRAVYALNDRVDKNIARPVASTYQRAMPAPARNGFHNFIGNLGEPSTIVNDLLQGKFKQVLQDTGRFILNSTAGLLGWFDVAKHVGLDKHDEDLGQTLAVWGVPSGPYLVLPALGPSTVRDAGGRVGDIYTDPPKRDMPPRYRNGELVLDGISTRAGLMEANDAVDSAYDPYAFVRDAYLQNRRYKINDGNSPESEMPDYDLPSDDGSTAPPATTLAAPAAVTTPASPTQAAPAAASTAPAQKKDGEGNPPPP